MWEEVVTFGAINIFGKTTFHGYNFEYAIYL